MLLMGHARLLTSDFESNALVELDLSGPSLTLRIASQRAPESLKSPFAHSTAWMNDVRLQDVQIGTPAGTIRADLLTDLMVTAVRPGEWAVYGSNLGELLDPLDRKTGIVSVEISAKRGELEFVPPEQAELSECLFRGNGCRFSPFQLTINGNQTAFSENDDLLVVRSLGSLRSSIDPILYGWAFLQGSPLRLLAFQESNTLRLSLSRRTSSSSSSRSYVDQPQLQAQIETLLRYISTAPLHDRQSIERAILFLISGSAGFVDISSNIINLFVSIEILDQSRTMAPNAIQAMFGINRADADYLVKVRNNIIHHGNTPDEASAAALQEIQSFTPGAQLTYFKTLADPINHSASFFFRTYALLVRNILDKAGYHGGANDFGDLLRNIEQ